jgi:hypothetical protein
MSPLVDTRVVTLHDPTTLPASFVGLELVVLAGAALTLHHPLAARRRGDRTALLTWITIVIYGLAMEVLAYNLVDNFAHGQLTVMFYDRQLPLYVVGIYPVLLYGGIAAARQLGLAPRVEPIAAGLLIVTLDAPFDVVGPALGWWRWFDGDATVAVRWLGVPVTSYLWHFAFGAILAALTAAAGRRGAGPAWALPLALATIGLGVVAFLPFHLGVALGLDDGVIVGAVLLAATALVVAARRRAPRHDRALLGLWLGFYGYHLAVAVAHAGDGGWAGRLGFIGLAAAIALAVQASGGLVRPPAAA